VQVATPDVTATPVAPPHDVMATALSKNSMLPVDGVPEPELTVAVYVTGWPTTVGEPVVETTEVVVATPAELIVTVGEVGILIRLPPQFLDCVVKV